MNAPKAGHNSPSDLDEDIEERAGNWFAVSRDIFTHHIVGIHNRPYTETEAWLSMLAMASYETRRVMNKGQMLILDPGDLMASHSYLATRWMWSMDKVRWYLKRLTNEAMITKAIMSMRAAENAWGSPGAGLVSDGNRTKENTKRNTNQIQVLTISNYSLYQFYGDRKHQAKHQHQPQANPKPAPSAHQESNTLTSKQEESPLPPKGGDGAGLFDGIPAEQPRKAKLTAEVTEACEIYNTAAKHFQFSVCESFTDARRKRVQKRLEDLGGIENFKAALRALGRSDPFVNFLRGKAPARPGEQPFRLDIDRLMQTNGNLGDVLAKLFDISRSAHAAPTATPVDVQASRQALRSKIAAMSDDQQRELLAAKANGIWPVQDLADPPIEPACAFRPHVLASLGISDGTYDRNGFKRR